MINTKAFPIFNIQLFANPNTNTTGSEGLSGEMKTYYDTELLENAREELYFNQFGKVQNLPQGKGKKVEWRKFKTYSAKTQPLTEGVTPDGNTMEMTTLEAEVNQYGDYTTVSDMLDLTAIDDVILVCTEEHGAQAGLTLDTLTRNALMKGTNVYRAGEKAYMSAMTEADKISATFVNKLVTQLKKNKVPKIDGKYIMIIHPSVSEDLRESEGWIEAHKYAATTEIFNGEIGELHGVRFIESNEVAVTKQGSGSRALYHNFIFGKDAYGRVELDGAAMEMIVKQMGSAGTADPLNQRSTVGWKAAHCARVLYTERIIRAVTASSYNDDANYGINNGETTPGDTDYEIV